MNETEIQLCNIDPDDIDDVIMKVQETFGIKPGKDAPVHINTFGELCDAVLLKIDLRHSNGCTSQQAFYKLREAILQANISDKSLLLPSSSLNDMFPKRHRRKAIKQVERKLGFSFKILRPKSWLVNLIRVSLLLSFIFIFFKWETGVAAFCFFIICIDISYYFGREFKETTLGEAATYISRKNYRKARRSQHTINHKEVVDKIKELFMEYLDLPEASLTREATFS